MSQIQDILRVIIAACTLHNICLNNDDLYEDFMDDIEEEVNGFENVLAPGCGTMISWKIIVSCC